MDVEEYKVQAVSLLGKDLKSKLYTLCKKIKCLKISRFQTGSDVVAGILIPVIHNRLVFAHMQFFFSLHYCNKLCLMFIKQRHKYICLIKKVN